jgi:hypothetical protein
MNKGTGKLLQAAIQPGLVPLVNCYMNCTVYQGMKEVKNTLIPLKVQGCSKYSCIKFILRVCQDGKPILL